MLGVDSRAQKWITVQDAHLGDVSRVVADRAGFADVRGKRCVEVSQSLEVVIVAVHNSGSGNVDQEAGPAPRGCRAGEAATPVHARHLSEQRRSPSGYGGCRSG